MTTKNECKMKSASCHGACPCGWFNKRIFGVTLLAASLGLQRVLLVSGIVVQRLSVLSVHRDVIVVNREVLVTLISLIGATDQSTSEIIF
mgnify:CR=1 FL=1